MISHQSGNFTIEIRVCSKALILIVTCMICISFLITHKDEYVNLRRNYNLDFGSENDITTFKPVKIFIVAFPRYAFLFCLFLASISILFLRSSNVMEVLFFYMKFWTNQYKNRISPKHMSKNGTFCSQLVLIFLKVLLAGRHTVQTAVQTTAENTLHFWTPRNDMGTICKQIS